jgi:predicted short-subunit dehydrogenase-like oxidoreductase (DUF2520 family)
VHQASGRARYRPTRRTAAKESPGLLRDEATLPRMCVIGPGRLGTTLVANLRRVGLPVTAIVGRRAAADLEALPPLMSLTEAAQAADVFWLTVPDDRIAAVAHDLALQLPDTAARPFAAVHCSGLGSLTLLEPLRQRGVTTLSVHPLQTFPGGAPDAGAFVGVPFAVTADNDDGRVFGTAAVHDLGGLPFDLADDAKPLYHLAAAMASNLLVALESEAAGLMAAATGRGPDDAAALLAPLVTTTAANLGAHGAGRALSGPVARGDIGTVRAHLALLEGRSARFAQAYRALSLEALSLAAPRLDNEAVRSLRTLLDESDTPSRRRKAAL